MRKEYIPRLLDSSTQAQLKSCADDFGLVDALPDIVSAADYVYAFYSKVGNNGRYFQEVFELIYMLKHCGGKMTFGAIMQKHNPILGLYKRSKLQTDSSSRMLQRKLLKLLEDSISDETKDFYYNHNIIEYEPEGPENEKYNDIISSALNKHRTGELTDDECKKIVEKYVPLCTDEPKRYADFYTEENLGKIIRYQREEAQKYPKRKQQLLGYYADMLLQRCKYDVFGYTQYFMEYLEVPDRKRDLITGQPQSDEEYYHSEEYQNFLSERQKQETIAAEYDESSTAVISMYNQYIFIYRVLWILGIILTSVEEDMLKTNKERYRYIRDCLRAYNKFSCEREKR